MKREREIERERDREGDKVVCRVLAAPNEERGARVQQADLGGGAEMRRSKKSQG